MRFIFKFPDIGEGITEGKLLEWYVKKGQKVKAGDHLVKMETDKVVADIPSPKDGVIVMCFGKSGDIIQVEDPLVELEIEGVSVEEAQKIANEKPKAAKSEQLEEKGFGVVGTLEVAGDGAYLPASTEGRQQEVVSPVKKKALATPVARALAKELGVDINLVTGSGPAGRVMKKDIRQYFEQKALHVSSKTHDAKDVQKVEVESLSQIRKAIAKRMVLSKNTAPHMTVFEEIEISELAELRKKQKWRFTKRGANLTYLPFVVKAVTHALKKHKRINSQFNLDSGQAIYKHYYNIGIAVDAPDGLVVPVIRNADKLSIFEIAVTIADLAHKARERKLTTADMSDGTFTITNFGAIAGIHAAPIINYPEVGILGVGRLQKLPVVKDEEIQIGMVLPLSLSLDHRAVDGGDASRFLKDIMESLADPVSLLLG